MIYNKKIIIGFSIILGICGIVVAAILTNQKTPDTSTQPQSKADTLLTIKNFSTYPDIDITLKATIESAINRYAADASNANTPTGVIREGSYKKTADDSASTITFLVDIADIKRSYKVSIGSDTTTGEQSLYVLCPSAEELIYPPFNCKDDLSEQ